MVSLYQALSRIKILKVTGQMLNSNIKIIKAEFDIQIAYKFRIL